jgi:hypothetical protein
MNDGPAGVGAHTKVVLLHQIDLSRRWKISPRTLERWRSDGTGPRYLKIGGRVRYRLEDVEAYEVANVHEAGEVSGDADEPARPPLTTL